MSLPTFFTMLFASAALLQAQSSASTWTVHRADFTPGASQTLVTAEVEVAEPRAVLVTFEATTREHTRIAAASIFENTAGRRVLRFSFDFDTTGVTEPVVRAYVDASAGKGVWDPALPGGAVFPLVDHLRVSSSFDVHARFVAPEGTSCAPEWREAPGWLKLRESGKTSRGGEYDGRFEAQRVGEGPAAAIRGLHWQCAIGSRRLPPFVSPLKSAVMVDGSMVKPQIAPTTVTALAPIVEARAGRVAELPFAAVGGGMGHGVAGMPGSLAGLPPGAILISQPAGAAGSASVAEEGRFQVYVPAAAEPGDYNVTAAHPNAGRPPVKWVLRVSAPHAAASADTNRRPVRLVLLYDQSANGWQLKQALGDLAAGFAGPKDQVHLVPFSTSVGAVEAVAAGQVGDRLFGLDGGSQTNLAGALLAVERTLKRDFGVQTVLLVVSNGLPSLVSTLGDPCPGRGAASKEKSRWAINEFTGVAVNEATGASVEWKPCKLPARAEFAGAATGDFARAANQAVAVANRLRVRFGARFAVLGLGGVPQTSWLERLSGSRRGGAFVTASGPAEVGPQVGELRAKILDWAKLRR